MVLGDPVSGKDFFGRKKEMETLSSILEESKNEEKRNVALIGIRKIGKTSIIKEFIRRLNNSEPDILCLEIYLPEQSPVSFFKSCIGSILLELARSIRRNIGPNTTIEQMMKIMENDFPISSLGLTNLMYYVSQSNFDEAFSYLFQLFDALRDETKSTIIVFLDEFQRLQEYDVSINSPVDKFREKIMNQKEILYVISGSAVGMLNRLISSTGSPLYGHFELLIVRGFEFEEARKFILGKKAELSIGESHLSFLYEITNGNPFYLHLLIHRLKRYCRLNGMQRIDDRMMEGVLMEEVFKVEGGIYSHFSLLLEQSLERKISRYYAEILKSIALGNRRPSQIARDIGMKHSTLSPYLKRLQELELIRKADPSKKNSKIAEYEILDSLLELWLKHVYSVRQNPLLKDVSTKLKVFKDSISEILEVYNSDIGRGHESRIRELFRKFDNEYLMGLSIPKFDSVESVNVNNEEIDLFCKSNDKIWVGDVSKTINRKEIEKMERKINSLPVEDKKKLKEVIIIALKDITPNAVGYAKELGYHVWSLEEVNRLMKRKSMFRILI